MLVYVANQNQNEAFAQQDWMDDTRFAKKGKDGLVAAAMDGDLTAFNQLVIAHQDSLYRWVLSLISDEALADDITQSTFISAYEKLSTFRGGSFRAWLFTIARNRSIDAMRRNKRYPAISLDAALFDDCDILSILPCQMAHPEEALVKAEAGEKIERLLACLPPAAQEVLRLIDMEEMGYQEAADVLHLPIGTVKSRLTRARLKLRQMLVKSSG